MSIIFTLRNSSDFYNLTFGFTLLKEFLRIIFGFTVRPETPKCVALNSSGVREWNLLGPDL